MPEFKNMDGHGATRGADISDDMVSKVGKAVGQIAEIKEAYREGLAAALTDDEKQELSQQAEQAAARAINRQGLSIEQYNDVVAAAGDNPDLEKRLLTAVQAA